MSYATSFQAMWSSATTEEKVQFCVVLFYRVVAAVAITSVIFAVLNTLLYAWLAAIIAILAGNFAEAKIAVTAAPQIEALSGAAARSLLSGVRLVRSWL